MTPEGGTAGITSWLDARLGAKARPVCELNRRRLETAEMGPLATLR